MSDRKVNRSDVAEEILHLRRLGFEYCPNRSGHLVFTHPCYGRIALPVSPARCRWQQNFRTRLARKLGCTRAELDERLGIKRRSRRRDGRAKGRRNVAGVQARKFAPRKPPSTRPPTTLADRRASVVNEIEGANARLRLAVPGSQEYKRLLARARELQSEFLQLEVDLKDAA